MYNLTNLNDTVLYGHPPYFVEVGPYVYREYKEKFNVTFSQGENSVAYNERTVYHFQPDRSCATCKVTDRVTNIWPTYTTLLQAYKGSVDAYLMSAFVNTSILLLEQLAELTTACKLNPAYPKSCRMLVAAHHAQLAGVGPLVPAGESWISRPLDDTLLQLLGSTYIADMFRYMNEIKLYPEFGFYSNQMTTEMAYNWLYESGSSGFPCKMDVSNIPGNSIKIGCMTQFLHTYRDDPNKAYNQYPISGTGITNTTSSSSSSNNSSNNNSDGNSNSNPDDLLNQLLVDETHNYLRTFGRAALMYLCNISGVPLYNDTYDGVYIGQSGQIWATHSVQEWLFEYPDPIAGLPGPSPEANTAYFNFNASNNSYSYYLNPAITTLSTGKNDLSTISAELGFEDHIGVLPKYDPSTELGYFCGGDAPVNGGGQDQAVAPGKPGWFGWQPAVSKDGHIRDDSDPEHNTEMKPVYSKADGKSKAIPTELNIWADDPHRYLKFSYYDSKKYRDFDVLRFGVDLDSLKIDRFNNDIIYDFTRDGIANMTCVKEGTPIHFTMVHFANANISGWEVDGDGIGPDNVIPDKHLTFLSVDPITGATLEGTQRLQINQVVKSKWITAQQNLVKVFKYEENNTHIQHRNQLSDRRERVATTSTSTSSRVKWSYENRGDYWANGDGMKLIPNLWVEDHAEMSDSQANDFKDQVIGTLHIHKVIFITSFTLAGFLIVIAGPILCYWSRHQKHKGDDLNLGEDDNDDFGYSVLGHRVDAYREIGPSMPNVSSNQAFQQLNEGSFHFEQVIGHTDDGKDEY